MRDIVVFILLLGLVPVALRRPIVGVAVYIVISIMNPHQLTWSSAARDFPWAMVYAAVITLAAFRYNGDRFYEALRLYKLPLVVLAWTLVTTLAALTFKISWVYFVAFAKVQYGVLIAIMCLRDDRDIRIIVGTLTGSVAFYGLKGFLFMLKTGGNYRVAGPSNTTIGDNNHLALAMTMVIPLLYWLATTSPHKWRRALMWFALVGCVFSTVGTYSRGGFVSLAVVAIMMTARSPRKGQIVALLLPIVALALTFMPDAFWDRMHTIKDTEQDGSVQGRIQAWLAALSLASDRITGGGFNYFQNPLNYIAYAPAGTNPFPRATHSIYFQALGEHGWLGLALFLAVFVGALFKTLTGRRVGDSVEVRHHNELLRALQVCFMAYLAGGAFLSLAQWDFAYYLYAVLLVLHARRYLPAGETQAAAAAPRPPANIFERPPSGARPA